MYIAATVLIVGLLLVLNEIRFRRRGKHSEFARKFVHLTVGSFVAFWPYYLEWWAITGLSAAFIVGVIVSKYANLFRAIHSVQRPTYGELCFAAAAGITSFVTHSPGAYAISLLHMSLADGLAAIVGVTYGKKTTYKVFGQTKSVVGTATFFVVSVALLLGWSMISGVALALPVILAVAAALTVIENIGVYGTDNLIIPVAVVLLLRLAAG